MPHFQSSPFHVRLTHPRAAPISLLGTLHTRVEVPEDYLQALACCQHVFFEVDIDHDEGGWGLAEPRCPRIQASHRQRLYRASLDLGLLPFWSLGMSPLRAALQLGAAMLEAPPMDVLLWDCVPRHARGPLESRSEVAVLLDDVEAEVQHAQLEAALEQVEAGPAACRSALEHCVRAWRAGRAFEVPEGLVEVLIERRERAWLPQILARARREATAVVCGSMHVQGLTDGLRASGYR